jgi:hypothetical protein
MAGKTVAFAQKGQAFVAWYCVDNNLQAPSAAKEGTDFY